MQALLGLGPSSTSSPALLHIPRPSPCQWGFRVFQVHPTLGSLCLHPAGRPEALCTFDERTLTPLCWLEVTGVLQQWTQEPQWSSVYLAPQAGRASLEPWPTPRCQEEAPAPPLRATPLAVLQTGSLKTSLLATLASKSREGIACLSHFCLRKRNHVPFLLLLLISGLQDMLLAEPL